MISMTDSTIAPSQKNSDFLQRTFRLLLDTKKGACYEMDMFTCFLVCEGLSTDDVGVARGTVLQEIRPCAGFKTDHFVKEKLGGATVERFACSWPE